jgi:hypothetical protein
MIYLKGALVGLTAALAASVISILAVLVLALLPFSLSLIWGSDAAGAGSLGYFFVSWSTASLLGIALVAFAIGFYWELRRVSKIR